MIHTETVHPSQLRRAMAAYAAQGYPPAYGPHPSQVGMMVIVITVPDGAATPDWHYAPPPRRRRWRLPDWRRLTMLACVLVIVGGLGYLGYTMASGGSLPTWEGIAASMPWSELQTPPAPRGEPVVESSGWHWPWESSVISEPRPQQGDGFRWPWQDAQDAVGEGIQALTNAVIAVGALVLLGGLLWLASIVRGAIGK